MSYEKQTWVTGETITAEKLNHIEDGVEQAGVVKWLIAELSQEVIEGVEADVLKLFDTNENPISYNDLLSMWNTFKYWICLRINTEDFSGKWYHISDMYTGTNDVTVHFFCEGNTYNFMAEVADSQLWQYYGG